MSDKKQIIPIENIQNLIFSIRGLQVMIDRDLAELYQVENKRLNEQIKRNITRFPMKFRFQLNDDERNEVVANCDRFKNLKHSSVNPYAFTEQGVSMLSAVLRSETAVKISIQIIDAFVEMRKFISQNASFFQRINNIEQKQIASDIKQLETDNKIDAILDAIEAREIQPKQGIFYDGQIFDAWKFVSDLIRSAKKSIVLIDNYVDDTVLTLFEKRKKGVSVTLLTKNISKQLTLDIKKFNKQYSPVEVKEFSVSHDRFLILDNIELYHFGASLKDLGKKWFAFSKMDMEAVGMLENLKKVKRV
ncbi:MAG: ORF6N domain-containing protein [Bacteroidetes bacterium]|nr:ORF6N domain-containing protein [Bacteroidota bacterium]